MSDNEKEKPQSKKAGFKVTPQNKHVPNCVHEIVVSRNEQLVYEKWLFKKADFPCGSCRRTENVVFMRTAPLNIVIRSCVACGVAEAVFPRDERNDPVAYPLETRVIDAEEARKILVRNKSKTKFLTPPLHRLLKAIPRKRVSPDELKDLEGVEIE